MNHFSPEDELKKERRDSWISKGFALGVVVTLIILAVLGTFSKKDRYEVAISQSEISPLGSILLNTRSGISYVLKRSKYNEFKWEEISHPVFGPPTREETEKIDSMVDSILKSLNESDTTKK